MLSGLVASVRGVQRLLARRQPLAQRRVLEDVGEPQHHALTCNVCGGNNFRDFRGRRLAECVDCRSLERTRLLKLALDLQKAVRPGMRVLHLAPKLGLGRYIKGVVGDGYTCADLRPERYPAELNPIAMDLIQDVYDLPAEHYDLVVHSHVMEHLPCDMTAVLYHLHRALKPGGWHAFGIPISNGRYCSDFSEMTAEERKESFGNAEHYRAIGRDDLDKTLGMVFHLNPYPFLKHVSEQTLEGYSVRPSLVQRITGSSIFMQDKESLRLR